MSNLEIGKRIRTLRTEKGLSREAFVEMKRAYCSSVGPN